MTTEAFEFNLLGKADLRALADRLLKGDTGAVEQCIAFIEAETLGPWHGRARAMMSRRLKHCRISEGQRQRVMRAILHRLVTGRFSEQFKDQLRLVLDLDASRAFAAARSCQGAGPEHIRRYAVWILVHEKS